MKNIHFDRWILLDSFTNCENGSTMSLSHNIYYNLLRYCKHFYPGKITKLYNISLHRMDDMWCNDLVILYLYSISLRCFINHFIMACHMKLLWVLCSWHVRTRLTSPRKLWSHLHGKSKRHFMENKIWCSNNIITTFRYEQEVLWRWEIFLMYKRF